MIAAAIGLTAADVKARRLAALRINDRIAVPNGTWKGTAAGTPDVTGVLDATIWVVSLIEPDGTLWVVSTEQPDIQYAHRDQPVIAWRIERSPS